MPRTQLEKLWMAGAAALTLLLAVIGWFFLISPQRQNTSAIREQVSSAQLANTGLQDRIMSLTSQKSQMASYKRILRKSQLALPSVTDEKATPDFLNTLQSLGAQTSTTVSQVTVGDATAMTATASAPATTSSSSTSAAASSSSSAAPTPTTSAAPSMYTIPISATVTGSMSELRDFLTQLQQVQPRAVLVTDITVGDQTPVATTTSRNSGARTSLNITMTAFAAPDSTTASVTVAASPVAEVTTSAG